MLVTVLGGLEEQGKGGDALRSEAAPSTGQSPESLHSGEDAVTALGPLKECCLDRWGPQPRLPLLSTQVPKDTV